MNSVASSHTVLFCGLVPASSSHCAKAIQYFTGMEEEPAVSEAVISKSKYSSSVSVPSALGIAMEETTGRSLSILKIFVPF